MSNNGETCSTPLTDLEASKGQTPELADALERPGEVVRVVAAALINAAATRKRLVPVILVIDEWQSVEGETDE